MIKNYEVLDGNCLDGNLGYYKVSDFVISPSQAVFRDLVYNISGLSGHDGVTISFVITTLYPLTSYKGPLTNGKFSLSNYMPGLNFYFFTYSFWG